nr:DEAD/DEAH box helicase [Myxococcota bacterium]
MIAASPFTALGLRPEIVRSVVDEGYTTPTPIQEKVLSHVLAGRDVIACAQTGTGKTAAFVLPLLEQLAKANQPRGPVRVLILTPTRELATQIGERIAAYGRHTGARHAIV